jgi:hypothetical protein
VCVCVYKMDYSSDVDHEELFFYMEDAEMADFFVQPLPMPIPFAHFALASPITNVILVWGQAPLHRIAQTDALMCKNKRAQKHGSEFGLASELPYTIVHFSQRVSDDNVWGTLIYNVAHVLSVPGIDPMSLPALFFARRAEYAMDKRGERVSPILVLNAPFQPREADTRNSDLVFVHKDSGSLQGMNQLLGGSEPLLHELMTAASSSVCPKCMLRDTHTLESEKIMLKCYPETLVGMLAKSRGHWCCKACYNVNKDQNQRKCPSETHNQDKLVYYIQ